MTVTEINALLRNADQASRFLKSVANETRLLILCHLVDGEKSVSELEAALELRQPNLSQQLARLRQDELVSARRSSKHVYYSIAAPQTRRVLELLCELFGRGRARYRTPLVAAE
jgi:DNA-binding transcriptional ArsR family regulator